MDFKKILEYNSLKNLHKRLMGLNNIQKVIMLFFAPCLIVLTFLLPFALIIILVEGNIDRDSREMLYNLTPLTLMLSFALYLFQSKK